MLDADRYWADFCAVIGHPELIADPRFVDMPARKANARACVEFLDEVFASLRLWFDRNHDGRTDPGELATLGEMEKEAGR